MAESEYFRGAILAGCLQLVLGSVLFLAQAHFFSFVFGIAALLNFITAIVLWRKDKN